jgi:hypothetical protein
MERSRGIGGLEVLIPQAPHSDGYSLFTRKNWIVSLHYSHYYSLVSPLVLLFVSADRERLLFKMILILWDGIVLLFLCKPKMVPIMCTFTFHAYIVQELIVSAVISPLHNYLHPGSLTMPNRWWAIYRMKVKVYLCLWCTDPHTLWHGRSAGAWIASI